MIGATLLHRKMPEKESTHLTPATRLLEKRREMAEVEQALASQKEVSEHGSNSDLVYSVHVFCY